MSKIIVWADGGIITGTRLKEAYGQKILTRRQVRGIRSIWFARCSAKGCLGEYNFSATTKAGARQRLCPLHIKKNVKDTYRAMVKEAAKKLNLDVFWRKTKHTDGSRFVPEVFCSTDGCKNKTRFRGWEVSAVLLCRTCSSRKQRLRPYEATYSQFLKQITARNTRSRKPIEITLSYEEFVRFSEANPDCFYCGKFLNRNPYVKKESGGVPYTRAAYIDRSDNEKGYTIKNILSCCGPCNMSKSYWVSKEEMMIIGQLRQGNIAAAKDLIDAKANKFKKWGKVVSGMSLFKLYGNGRSSTKTPR